MMLATLNHLRPATRRKVWRGGYFHGKVHRQELAPLTIGHERRHDSEWEDIGHAKNGKGAQARIDVMAATSSRPGSPVEVPCVGHPAFRRHIEDGASRSWHGAVWPFDHHSAACSCGRRKVSHITTKLRVHTVHSSRGDRLGTPIRHAHKVDMVHPHRELREEVNR